LRLLFSVYAQAVFFAGVQQVCSVADAAHTSHVGQCFDDMQGLVTPACVGSLRCCDGSRLVALTDNAVIFIISKLTKLTTLYCCSKGLGVHM
jgi:hypothetical protein